MGSHCRCMAVQKTIAWTKTGWALTYFVLAFSSVAVSTECQASPHRSPTVKAEFQRLHPCPSTGKTRGACPGYVKDHVIPLCAGGADAAFNLQWSDLSEAKKKDVEELRLCRMIKRGQIQAGSDRGDLCRALLPSEWPLLTKDLCGDGTHAIGSN